jgi:hypothetical protein
MQPPTAFIEAHAAAGRELLSVNSCLQGEMGRRRAVYLSTTLLLEDLQHCFILRLVQLGQRLLHQFLVVAVARVQKLR